MPYLWLPYCRATCIFTRVDARRDRSNFSFTHQIQGQNESSVIVIPGDDITQNLTQSLGEHLSTTAGVSSNNFGPAVGQPVIRGMGGNRVKVLQNNLSLGTFRASGLTTRRS